MTHNTRIYIDPRCRINYASYYVFGLTATYGKKRVVFDVHPFKDVVPLNTQRAQANGICFMLVQTVRADERPMKVYIDFHDSSLIDMDVYHWCDVYAKVNLNLAYEPGKHPKIIAIGPNFAIDIWSWCDTLYYGLKHLFITRKYLKLSVSGFLKDYLHLKWRRKPIGDYLKPVLPDPDYLFSMSTLWYDRETAATTNSLRGLFFRLGQKYYKRFEGGFFYVNNKVAISRFPAYERYLEEYSDCIYRKRIDMTSYIAKSKRSAIVFNTPSVSGCLGWKLGEYLCMGKAIISSPLNRMMPGNAEDLNFAHFVSNNDQLEEAVALLQRNDSYRRGLERNATEYFRRYLTPEVVIRRIIHHFSTQKIE